MTKRDMLFIRMASVQSLEEVEDKYLIRRIKIAQAKKRIETL